MSPNKAKLETPAHAQSTATGACLHCGRPTAASFCCPGCRHVHEYLTSEGLTRYYDLMASIGRHAPSQSIADGKPPAKPDGREAAEAFRYRGRDGAYAFHVPALSCAACLWIVERILNPAEPGLEDLASVRVNLDDRLIVVTTQPGRALPLAAILTRIEAIGYKPLPPRLARAAQSLPLERRRALQHVGIAGAIFGNVMLFATAVYFGDAWGMPASMRRFFDLFSGALATLALVTAGRGFFVTAWSSARHRMLHVDLPIAVALALSFGVSLVSVARGEGPVYFDSVTGLIFLLLAGRYLNDSLQARARHLAGSAAALLPPSAATLQPGNEVDVAPGETLPADGVVLTGTSEVDESALTGEQRPVLKHPGEDVQGGTQNLNGALRIRVTRSGEDCGVARVARLVEEATRRRSPFETMAARLLPRFVAGIFVAAAVALAVWYPKDPSRALEVVAATLIVSCPCALALATPLTMATAMKRAWRHGVIVKSAEALESAAALDAIVLDKTGTLTTGNVRVVRVVGEPLLPEEQEVLGATARRSRHPVARAIAAHFAWAGAIAADVQELPGQGFEARGRFGGRNFWVRVGRASYVGAAPALPASGSTAHAAIAWDGGAAKHVTFLLEDPLHADARSVVESWQADGLEVFLLTGDTAEAAAPVARAVGIDPEHVKAQTSPEEKREFVATLQAGGKAVMMVGDGVNDAAALATATLGVAVSGGVDLALGSADVFLGAAGVAPLAGFLRFARHARRTLAIILALSVSYNLAAVALAVGGFLHPLVAALIMPLASLTVVTIGALRRGEQSWKSSTSSCPWPSPSRASPSLPTSGPFVPDSSTT